MATTSRIEQGQYYILSYQSNDSPIEWTPLACLTQKSFTSAVNAINVTSDCGPSSIGGTTTQTFNIAGFVDYEGAAVISAPNLYDLQIDAQNSRDPAYSWKIEPATPVAKDQTLEFDAFISNFKENWQTDQPVDFTVDLTIQGIAVQTIN